MLPWGNLAMHRYTAPLGPLGRVADALFLRRYMRELLRRHGLHLKRVAESGG